MHKDEDFLSALGRGASFGDLRALGVRVARRTSVRRSPKAAPSPRSGSTTSSPRSRRRRPRSRQHDAKLTELDNATRQALERAQQAGKLAEGKFVYSLVLSDDAAKFPVNQHELSTEAQEPSNAFAERLKGENKNVYLEIQGHTDATGSDSYNLQARRSPRRGGAPLPEQAGRRPEPDVDDLLREERAGRVQQDQGRPVEEPPRGGRRPRLAFSLSQVIVSRPGFAGPLFFGPQERPATFAKSAGSGDSARDRLARSAGAGSRGGGRGASGGERTSLPSRASVDAVAEDRMPGRREVDADLVRAPGLRADRDERGVRRGARPSGSA